MRIALDAMGGDRGPELLVDGALRAVQENKSIEIVLLGPKDFLDNLLVEKGIENSLSSRLLVELSP